MNVNTIRWALDTIKPNALIEVRVVDGKRTTSGYFRDVDLLLHAISRYETSNIYFVLNEINEACYSREQKDRMFESVKNSTSDNDITRRQWLLVDVDPQRVTGVSANDEEKEIARVVSNKVFTYLRDVGFSEPVCADSGNGYHLLYKINAPNDEDTKKLLQRFLQVLDIFFSVDGVGIDKGMFNASRITKLYGTVARKGVSTDERPHRESALLRVPDDVKETPISLIKNVAALYPEREAPKHSNNYGQNTFDLDEFIKKHGIDIRDVQRYGDGDKYILDHCVFDESHTGKDACLFKMASGAIGYKCFHNSCSEHKWQDVRKLFEPTAYEKLQSSVGRVDVKLQPQRKDTEKGDKFLQISEISEVSREDVVSVPSGFTQLDKKIIGFNKGEVTLWSGKNGSAKSTILGQVTLNGIQRGFKHAMYSGELTKNRVKQWVTLQAAGRQYNIKTQWEGVYGTPKYIADRISKWLDGKLWLYNNDYGNDFDQLLVDLSELVERKDIDVIVIDNLMSLSLERLDGYKNEKQTTFINKLCRFTKDTDVHVHIVAHPRKNTGFLRKDDISGTADLTNAVDNVIISHRNNMDFQRAIGDFFPSSMQPFLDEHSNYIEVCKNRDLGVEDYIVGLHFEAESKRLLNEKYENLCFGWQEVK